MADQPSWPRRTSPSGPAADQPQAPPRSSPLSPGVLDQPLGPTSPASLPRPPLSGFSPVFPVVPSLRASCCGFCLVIPRLLWPFSPLLASPALPVFVPAPTPFCSPRRTPSPLSLYVRAVLLPSFLPSFSSLLPLSLSKPLRCSAPDVVMPLRHHNSCAGVCPRGLATPGCVLCARPPESHSVVSNTHFTAPPLPFLLRARLDPEVKPGSPLPFTRSFARFAPGLTFVSNQASPAPFVVSAQFCPNMGQNRAPPCFCPAARGRPGRASPPQPPAVLSNAHALGGENSNTANNRSPKEPQPRSTHLV